MKKAIVTGATGGLGRNLVQTLLTQGWQVAACGRNAEIGKMLDTEFHAFDLSDHNQTLKAFSDAEGPASTKEDKRFGKEGDRQSETFLLNVKKILRGRTGF